jgi:hypothetical protein
MKYLEILKTKVNEFSAGIPNNELISEYRQIIHDNDYFIFLEESKNGGFFFNKGLHIYGYSEFNNFHNADFINRLLTEKYGEIVKELVFFGQDLFGNQFSFDIKKNKIVFFNIETGEREIIANDFIDWMEFLIDQLEYFTGNSLAANWNLDNNFRFDQRLSPKMPFILGGEYKLDNLYASDFPQYINSAAEIAKQVYNLPDGANFKIKISKK